MRQEARGMPLWHSPRKQARRPGLVTARKKNSRSSGKGVRELVGLLLAFCELEVFGLYFP